MKPNIIHAVISKNVNRILVYNWKVKNVIELIYVADVSPTSVTRRKALYGVWIIKPKTIK